MSEMYFTHFNGVGQGLNIKLVVVPFVEMLTLYLALVLLNK